MMQKFLVAAAFSLFGALAACGSTPIPFGTGADGGVVGPSDPARDGGGTTTPSADGGSTSPVADGGSTNPDPRIACGTTTCSADTQDCCVTRGGQSCVARGQCQGAPLSCSGPSSCGGGEVCCLDQSPNGASAACAQRCEAGEIQLCGTDAECPMGFTCQRQQGVSFCGRVPPRPDGGILPRPDGGPDNGLSCGSTRCDAATEDCCVSLQGAACGARGSCSGSALSCTSPRACGGNQVCCATAGSNFEIHATCVDTCNTGGGSGGGFTVQLCAVDADCPMGQRCGQGVAGVRSCRGGGMGGGMGGGGG